MFQSESVFCRIYRGKSRHTVFFAPLSERQRYGKIVIPLFSSKSVRPVKIPRTCKIVPQKFRASYAVSAEKHRHITPSGRDPPRIHQSAVKYEIFLFVVMNRRTHIPFRFIPPGKIHGSNQRKHLRKRFHGKIFVCNIRQFYRANNIAAFRRNE